MAEEDRAPPPRGVRSGEICVRVQHEVLLSADGGVAAALAPALRAFALDAPTLAETMAPWTRKLEALRQRQRHVQERRRLVRQRYDATRAAMDELAKDPQRLVNGAQTAATEAVDQFTGAFESLAQLHARHAMDGALRYCALLEEERARIAAWQLKDNAACQALVRATKRRHHLTYESETSGQIRLRRLPEGDAQRARCVKAASENVKKGFFTQDGTKIEVSDVYKIDNAPLLRAFERWVARHTAPSDAPKVKGLFCSVPVESLERCVVWGMFGDEYALGASTGTVDEPIFNRPDWQSSEAPGTQRARFVARHRVEEATPMQFPRRFSRYSTLQELRDAPVSDLRLRDAPTRYLALCRVAMGKTQRVSGAKPEPQFPDNAAVGSLFFSEQEEYVPRYPEAVVPEFLVEYRFVRPTKADSDATETVDRLIPVRLSAPHRELLPSTAFEASVKTLMNDLLGRGERGRSVYSTSLLTSLATLPPVFHPGPAIPATARSVNRSDCEGLSTEKILELCGRRRRVYADDLQQLRGILWGSIKGVWDAIDQPLRATRRARNLLQADNSSRKPIEDQGSEREESRPTTTSAKRQSFKAQKLYSELALERQLQANDVARLDALVRGKLSLHSKLKKKDGVANKPRPFR